MPRIKRIITLTAIAAATAIAAPAIDAAASSAGSGSGPSSTPTHADLVAAELAATHTSAPLYQFGLMHIHAIPPITATTTSHPDRFQLGDAAIDQHTAQSVPGGPPILPRVRASEQAAINRAQAREAQALAYSPPPAAQYRMEELNANASAVHPVAAATPTVKTPGGGFDWGDAGIGAAGGLALAMLGLAGALTLSQRRARRSSRTAALTS